MNTCISWIKCICVLVGLNECVLVGLNECVLVGLNEYVY